MLKICLLAIFVTFNRPIYCECPADALNQGYYWRDYFETIPKDAIIGGEDANNNDLYIGQVLSKDDGLIVVQLRKGEKSVEAPIADEVRHIDSNIKILCGNGSNFQWIKSSGSALGTDLIGNRPVIGGTTTAGLLYIGRAYYGNSIQVGRINSWKTDNASLTFVFNKEVKAIYSYEILVNA